MAFDNSSVDNHTFAYTTGALEFVVVVGLAFEVAFVTEVVIGLEPEPEPGAIVVDFVVSAEIVAVASVAEAEAFD